ncbi:MAG: sigma-54 dependent transcriptional regulator [Myxococcaceae bacterium]|nr:sigma-54 dependent transcriptional regulator [Myxococcaceae bacterium]
MARRLLVIDDEKDMCDLLQIALERAGHQVIATTSAKAALELVAQEDIDVVLTDLGMAEMSGIAVCERVLGTQPDIPVVVVTGQNTMDSVVAALRAGAYDFITKPVDTELLKISVERAISHRRLHEEVKRLRLNSGGESSHDLLGQSLAMRRVHDLISRVATSDASVLVHGETGTGKELIARALHGASNRKAGPFVAINCAAVPQTLIESELFGHSRGAFTDAKAERTGLFLQATGGTLFLDEIAELPIEMQPKLLRALQERKVRPVGSNTEVPFDVRLVTATNRDLEYEVFQKRFREDLFYRVNVVTIEVPPLRERPGDVLLLAQHFLKRFAGVAGKPMTAISETAAEKLVNYEWPGNVRELENCIERGVALGRFDQLTVEDLPQKVRGYRAPSFVVSADDTTEVVVMEEVERRYIMRVLGLVGGNKSQAAQLLGFDRRTLYRKLARYEAEAHREAAKFETQGKAEA